MAVPILGPSLFYLFGPERLERKAIKRKRLLEMQVEGREETRTQLPAEDEEKLVPVEETQVLKLAKKVSEYVVTSGNSFELLPDPLEALTAMHKAIDEAKLFVHLEYYIIASDEVTEQLFTSLEAAAQRGVEVRILYDSLGSLSLKRIYFRRLVQQGVKIAGFLPFSILPQRINFNFRNHRKILVIDGKTAFTGGTNIGKQYLGRLSDSQWRDYTVKIKGPVCLQLQDVFAKDWHFTTQEDLFDPKYYPTPTKAGASVVQVLESGPDSAFHILHQTLFLLMNLAEKEILLTTPYFVPDPSILSALTVAALRGLDVTLLLPAKSDSQLVRYASRSFYDLLLKAGVKIFEYQPRILHSKLMTIDGKWTLLGSANMDTRSFHHNFELNLLIYGRNSAKQASEQIRSDLGHSHEIVLEEFMKRSLRSQLLENACRLLSPIL